MVTTKRRSREANPVVEAQIKAMAFKGFVTPDVASRMAKVPRSTIYTWIRQEQVVVERIGFRRVYISVASLREVAGMLMDPLSKPAPKKVA